MMLARWHLEVIEKAAGIEKALEELTQRNAFLASAEQQFNEERQIIFAIPDLTIRRQVIDARRECHRLCRANEEQKLHDLQTRVSNNGERIRRKHLLEAVVMGLLGIFVGDHYFDSTGALAGAIVVLLVGFDHIRRGNRLAIDDVEEARKEIPEMETFLRELGMEGIFSIIEEETGQPDPTNVLSCWPQWS